MYCIARLCTQPRAFVVPVCFCSTCFEYFGQGDPFITTTPWWMSVSAPQSAFSAARFRGPAGLYSRFGTERQVATVGAREDGLQLILPSGL